jgi:hypothetical protein
MYKFHKHLVRNSPSYIVESSRVELVRVNERVDVTCRKSNGDSNICRLTAVKGAGSNNNTLSIR